MSNEKPLSDLLREAAESHFASHGDHAAYRRLMDAAIEANDREDEERAELYAGIVPLDVALAHPRLDAAGRAEIMDAVACFPRDPDIRSLPLAFGSPPAYATVYRDGSVEGLGRCV